MAQQVPRTANLSGRLGVGSIVFMVIAAAAPLTVIGGNVPLAIGEGNGAGAPMGFIIAAVVLLVFSVGFVTMAPHVKEAGAFYAYISAGLGNRLGKGAAFTALVSYTAIQLGVYGYLGWAVNDAVRRIGGPELPWWGYALLALLVVAFLGYRHIELSAKVLGVALILEIAVVVVMDAAIFLHGGAAGISAESFTPEAVFSGPLGVAVLFALTGFIGFEATAVFRDEARNPARTIPRATYLAVLIIGVFYALSCWAIIEGVSPSQAVAVAQQTLNGEANMLLDTAETYTGVVVRDVMNVLLLSSLFACVLSFHNVIARYQFVLSRKGQLPGALGKSHPVHHSPAISSIVQSGTALLILAIFAVLGLDPLVGVFSAMAGVSTVGMVLLMLLTSVAILVFFNRRSTPRLAARWKTTVAPVLAVLGLAVSLWLVIQNFTLVTAASVGVSVILGIIPVLALAVGWIIGHRGKREVPENSA
ncbi:amino acid transporter [Psychromicrobium lacuslunae]|uniref:Amino acid transporter n=1 Tax=Psychromicrobium lacuslunae TaxID=1618207 RepID=A0A0D4C392_9MICC|nr:amino acid transporter [Psychromicrobium lacuslunae]